MDHVSTDLADLLLGSASDQDRLRIERHLSECPSCRDEWISISALARTHFKTHELEVPNGYFASLPSRIFARRTTEPRNRMAAWIQPAFSNYLAPLTAGILLIVVVASLSTDESELQTASSLPVSTEDAVEYVSDNDAIFVLEPISSQLTYVNYASLVGQDPSAVHIPGLEDLETQSVHDFVSGLSDVEVDRLIERLNERTIL